MAKSVNLQGLCEQIAAVVEAGFCVETRSPKCSFHLYKSDWGQTKMLRFDRRGEPAPEAIMFASSLEGAKALIAKHAKSVAAIQECDGK